MVAKQALKHVFDIDAHDTLLVSLERYTQKRLNYSQVNISIHQRSTHWVQPPG